MREDDESFPVSVPFCLCASCNNECQLNPAVPCTECETDDDCGGDDDLCLDLDDGKSCGRACDTHDDCPADYLCEEVSTDGGTATQCIPLGNACGICPDNDKDGVCNDDDRCDGGNDLADDDADGVPNRCDVCPGEDDTIDDDDNGLPDACECNDLNCDANSACRVEESGNACVCIEGFVDVAGDCVDRDECGEALDDCEEPAECENRDGDYQCSCPTGYAPEGRTCQVAGRVRLRLSTHPRQRPHL